MRILAAILALVLALTFNACSGGDDDSLLSSSSGDGKNESSSSNDANGGNPNNGGSSSSNGYSSGNDVSSSSNGYNSGNDGNNVTYTHVITEMNQSNGTFTYTIESEWHSCGEGGVSSIDIESSDMTSAYSISNNVLAFWRHAEDKDDNDSLHFNGTSNSIFGTWTRTKNEPAPCGMREYKWCSGYIDGKCAKYETEEYWDCKYGYNIVKAEIFQNTFKVTANVCLGDEVSGAEENGIRSNVIDCNTIEALKGSEKITLKFEWSGRTKPSFANYTYNGKTCKNKVIYTHEDMIKACAEAWTKYNDEEYYWDILDADFKDCIESNNFPSWVWVSDDDSGSSNAPVESSMLMKKSNVKVPKKKNPFGILQRMDKR
jgi:hypothetical protein